MATLTDPETEAPEAPPRGRWRRRLLYIAGGAAGAIGIGNILGLTTSLLVLGGAGAVTGGALYVRHYSRLQHHFHPFGKREKQKRERRWTRTTTTRGSRGFRAPAAFRRTPGIRTGLGRGRTRSGTGRKLPGLGRRKTGNGKGSPLLGKGKGRKLGTGRAGSGRKGILGRGRKGKGLGSGRSGTGRKRLFGKGRSGSGSGRKGIFGRGKGRSGSGRKGLFGRGKGRTGTGSGKRGLFRKNRGNRSGSGKRPGAFARFRKPAGRAHKRGFRHPFGGKRTSPRITPRGRSVPRSRRHPFGGKRTTSPRGRSRPRSPFHPFGGRRTHSPSGRSRPRSMFHPFGGRRTLTRPGRSRPRSMFHPFGGRRTTPVTGRRHPRSIRHPFGGRRTGRRTPPKGRSRARSWRHPFGGTFKARRRRLFHPSTWRYPRKARKSRPPGRVRRRLYRFFGTPQQRHNRRAARKAHRARNRANRRRRSAGTWTGRTPWYAPWRVWTRGGGAKASWRRFRARHGYAGRAPHIIWPHWARPSGLRARFRRRRALYRGLGISARTPLRLRLRHWFGRHTWAPRWRNLRRRLSQFRSRRRMPRPLARSWQPRWLRNLLGRRDRRRQDRWLSRRRRTSPGRLRRPSAPDPVQPSRNGSSHNGNHPGTRTTGGRRPVANVREAADQIQEMVQEWIDANDLDETLEGLHEIPRAIQAAFHNYAEQLRDNTNLREGIPSVVEEAGAQMAGIADSLQQEIQYGVQRN